MASSFFAKVYGKKVSVALAGLILGLLLSSAGCTTMGPDGKTDGERLMDDLTESLLGGGILARANGQIATQQGDYKGAAGWTALADAQQNAYDRETAKEAAREGRTEVNVDTDETADQRESISKTLKNLREGLSDNASKNSSENKSPFENPNLIQIYTATWDDKNKDGKIGFDELEEHSSFRLRQKAYLIILNYGPSSFHLKVKVLDKNTGAVTPNGAAEDDSRGAGNGIPYLSCFEIDDVDNGDYLIVTYIDGRKFGSDLEFRIGEADPNYGAPMSGNTL